MATNGWDLTLKVLSLLTDIDKCNEKLSKTDISSERDLLCKKIDDLESEFFDIKNKLKRLESN